MHLHLETEATHGNVAEHNIAVGGLHLEVQVHDRDKHLRGKEGGEIRCVAKLIDFGNAGFKDVSVLGTPQLRSACGACICPLRGVNMM